MADGLFKEIGKVFINQLHENKRDKVFHIIGSGTTGLYGEIVSIQDLIPLIKCCCSRLIEESSFHRPLAERIMECIREWNYEGQILSLKEVISKEPNNGCCLGLLASLYSDCPEDKFRNGEEAVKLARKACKLTNYQDSLDLMILAQAYAECADFEKAIEYQKKSNELAEYVPEECKERLAAYKARKPWRRDRD